MYSTKIWNQLSFSLVTVWLEIQQLDIKIQLTFPESSLLFRDTREGLFRPRLDRCGTSKFSITFQYRGFVYCIFGKLISCIPDFVAPSKLPAWIKSDNNDKTCFAFQFCIIRTKDTTRRTCYPMNWQLISFVWSNERAKVPTVFWSLWALNGQRKFFFFVHDNDKWD